MTINQLPSNFRGKYPNSSIASYDYIDLADGTGVLSYTATICATDSGTTYLLNTKDLENGTTNTFLTNGTYNFDTEIFNSPRTIKGTAYLSTAINYSGAGSLTIKFQKISGSTTTDISSSIVKAVALNLRLLMPIPLTQTNFKRGDYLRAVITLSGAGNSMNIYPATTTPLKINVPYRINT